MVKRPDDFLVVTQAAWSSTTASTITWCLHSATEHSTKEEMGTEMLEGEDSVTTKSAVHSRNRYVYFNGRVA